MIINAPKIIKKEDSVRVEAEVITNQGKSLILWAEIPSEFESFIATDCTAIASPLVLPASKRKEDIKILGVVSKKWLEGTNNIIDRTVGWKTGFNKINIHADDIRIDEVISSKNVASFFSGGVDSFCTLIKYKNDRNIPLTHLLFVHGYDIALDNTSLFETVKPKLTAIANTQNLQLVIIKTNVREITDELLNWEMAHGGALAFVALLLRKGFSNIIIPGAGESVFPLEPWGSVPTMDPLWSTEGLNIIHDHDLLKRFEKIQKYIAGSQIALENVRVCWRNNGYNCGVCDKCLMTMADLRVAGVLDKVKTFPNRLDTKKFERLYVTQYSIKGNVIETLEYLQKSGKDPELEKALTKCLEYSDNPGVVSNILKFIHDLDAKYNESRLFVFMQRQKRTISKLLGKL